MAGLSSSRDYFGRSKRAPSRCAPKAANLGWLKYKAALNVPEFWVLEPGDSQVISDSVFAELDQAKSYAVRSAALAEDGEDRSFAGQFETVLNVRGQGALDNAVKTVLSATRNERVSSYAGEDVPLVQHIIIQKMIAAKVAGVAFSRNPMTALNEVVIEAITGTGDKLVDQGQTPDRFVWRGKGFIEQPSSDSLPASVAEEIATTARKIEKKFKRPVDLEWAWDGAELWWLQVRPITGIGDARLYSNRISREVMPGMITPLVWSINVPLVNGAWIRFLERAVGQTGLRPNDLAKQFAFRSYFNMTALGRVFELLGMPPDALEVMLGLPNTPRPSFTAPQKLLVRLPRLAGFAAFLLGYERPFQRDLPDIERAAERATALDPRELNATEILEEVDQLLPQIGKAAELNIVAPILANIYAGMLRRRMSKTDFDYVELDLTKGVDAFAHYDPKPMLTRLGAALSNGEDGKSELDALLERFGHVSENTNDLALPPWSERPDHVMDQARAAHSAPQSQQLSLDDVSPALDMFVRSIAKRAQRFQLHREAISFEYARLYSALRPLLLNLGEQLTAQKQLSVREDIFFLNLNELRSLVAGQLEQPMNRIEQRQAEFEAVRNVRMPETIYSDGFVPLPAHDGELLEANGTGVSKGQAKGKLRILTGFEDFDRVESGDIIVIPFSDVGWTPVFAKAGGVVSEAGGMLSHSAIVAREYGIPCIVSVPNALELPEGREAMIDGVSGTLVVLEAEHD